MTRLNQEEFDTYFKYTSKGADGKANIEAVASETDKKVDKDASISLNTGASSGSSLTGGKIITITSSGDDSTVSFKIEGEDVVAQRLKIITGKNANTAQSTKNLQR